MAAPQASSRLEMLQARFQQKQLQEKEQKLLQLYDQQQQRAYQVVQRNSSGGSSHGSNAIRTATMTTTTTTTTTSTSHGGKVRQMFDERRQTKGIDRSYPLEPLENKLRKQTNVNGVAMPRNGNASTTATRQSVKRVARADVNSNINGGKPVVSYHEEISRESFGPSVRRHDDEDEYGVENRVATYANGYYHHEADNEQEDEVLDQETMERNRMMAKIHLMGFDESMKHRVRNDLESEEFPEYLMTDVPDKLTKRNVTKKMSQAEARLERFKNANAKRSNTLKQTTPIGNAMKKRSEQATKANPRRGDELAGTSPIGARSGSSRIIERSQRILESAKNPRLSATRVADETKRERRRGNSDIEIFSDVPQSFPRGATMADKAARIYPGSNGFKSVTSDGKIFVRRSASPQFFCKESERSATTMSIDRQSDSPGSPLFYRGTLTKRTSPFFLDEFEQSLNGNESKSPMRDRRISLRPTVDSRYQESKQFEMPVSTDRKSESKSSVWSKEILTKPKVTDFDGGKFRSTSLDRKISFKSPSYEEEMLKKRSGSPQFFCKESERSGATMTIDRAFGEPGSSSYDRESLTKRSESPRFFLRDSEQYRRKSGSESPTWSREISWRRSLSPRYGSKRSETALSTDRETTRSKSSERSKEILTKRKPNAFDGKLRSTSLDRKASSKSPLFEEEILKKRSGSPQFFCKESERSGTTMTIDRAFRTPRTLSYDREMSTKRTSPFFLNEFERYRRTSKSKSPIWNKEISSGRSESPRYREYKRSEAALSTDRDSIRSKSSDNKQILTKQKTFDFDRKLRTSTSLDRKTSRFPSHEQEIFKKRSGGPQFFCKESERSGTTMAIDHASREPRPSSYDRESLTKRGESPRFYVRDSEQHRRKSGSESPIWNKEISSRRSLSPRYGSKRPETALSTDRETTRSKSSERSKEILTKSTATDFDREKFRSTSLDRKISFKSPSHEEEMLKKRSGSPQFFCKESERSGTTMAIDRAFREPRSSSYDREMLSKRITTPRLCRKIEQQSTNASDDRRYSRINETLRATRDKRAASPQFFGLESETSATTMSIEPGSIAKDDKNILKQRHYIPNVSYKRSMKPSINKKITSSRGRQTPSPLFTKHESMKSFRENAISNAVTEIRRSSKISETSATSSSSIVSLKYGLEFDNIFESAGLVRRFMKSHNGGQRKVEQTKISPTKRNTRNENYIVKGNQSRNRYKTSSPFQKARSPSVESGNRVTSASPRKSLTPTEVDVEIQEITMTDHRIERDKLRKASTSPIAKRRINGTRSPSNRAKFKISITYPIRKAQRQRASILESSVVKSKGDLSGESSKYRLGEGSAISLNKLDRSPAGQSFRHIITRNQNRMSEGGKSQRWDRFAKSQVESVALRSDENRRRSTSRASDRTRDRAAREEKAGDSRASSPDSLKGRKYIGTISPIPYNSVRRSEGTRDPKFGQPQNLRSAHLVRGALRDKNLSADGVLYNRSGLQDKSENLAMGEVDDGIDSKYRTVVETALNEKTKDFRKGSRRNSADQIANKKVPARETTRASMKSNTSKRTISPTKDCGRQHDVKFRVSPRVSPLRRTAEISRGVDTKISPCRKVVPKVERDIKFFTHTVKDRKREKAKRSAGPSKMNVKRDIEEMDDTTREFSNTRREDKSERDFNRMDSVESALKRFDSIGVEFEHSAPTSFRASSEISLRTMDTQAKVATEKPIVSEKATIIPPRDTATTLRSTVKSPVGGDLKVKNVRKSDSRILGKQIRSFDRRANKKTGDLFENKQRSTQTRSPTCKRRLFGSDWQIEETQSKFARKKQNYSPVSFKFLHKYGTVSKTGSSKSLDRADVMMRADSLERTPAYSVKALRSIEDIRKSFLNERDALIATDESRSAIANWRSASRDVVDARGPTLATDTARNVFLGCDPARLIKVKSCVSRITKSPSPDSAARKQHETNARATRGSAPTSPSKSPDIVPRHTSTESKNQEAKPSRKSAIAKGADSIGNKASATGTVDTVDGVVLQNGSPHDFTTKSSDAFVIDFNDRPSKENNATPSRKSSTKKSSTDKQQTASSASGRPTSSSNSSAGSTQGQVSNTKGKMTSKIKKPSDQAKNPSPPRQISASHENLVACKVCNRRFARDRIDYHEQICTTNVTASKKRKPFDPVMSRVKGTELESFVKKSLSKKDNSKAEKWKTKSNNNWRRQHEDFINAIRSAKQVQAHLAAGGNLRDLPPPPPSDTSDYIQCPHCGRRFNPAAAERHIPKCQNMLHNKPAHARAPRR